MKRRTLWSMCGLALLISFLMSAESSAAPKQVILDAKGNVRNFYGIPITLTRAGLKRLPYRVKKEYYYAEGDRYPRYRITAKNKVDVFVTFERDGKFASAWTESRNAFGLKGIRVGSTLADLRAAWPDGDFLFYFEDGYVVTFRTPANVSFMFDEKDMPPSAFNHDRPTDFPVPDDIKVKMIAVFPNARPPLAKGPAPIGSNKPVITIETEDRQPIAKLEVERAPDSSLVRLTWTRVGHEKFDAAIDVSKYPEFDEWTPNLVYDVGPIVVAFRYGRYKDCSIWQEDRDKMYVTLDAKGATLSSRPPESIAVPKGYESRKSVGQLMNSAAHGCRRTYDPRTGAFGLERDEE